MPSNYTELGRSGLNRWGEWISEEFLPALHGQKAIRVYREMRDNDPIVGAFFFAIEMLIRNVPWEVRPADETDAAREIADFIESARDDLDYPWEDFLTEVLSMLQYGWSFHEIVYKPRNGKASKWDDGKIGWKGFPIRSQDTLNGWIYDEKDPNKLTGFRQLSPPDFKDQTLPFEKGLLFRTTSYKNNPEGRSILRNAYRPWYFKKRMEEIEGIGVERDLAGLPVAYVDPAILGPNATEDEVAMRDALLRLVQNIRRDKQEGVLFPRAYDKDNNLIYELELLNSGGTRQFPTHEIITRYDQRIAMVVLADFILLGTQNVGSWALSADKSNLFGMAINSWLQGIASVLNQFAIPRLVKLNKMDPKLAPTIKHGEVQPPDLEALGSLIKNLSGAGMPLFPDEDLEAHIRKVAHLPEKSDDTKDLQDHQGLLDLDLKEQQAQQVAAQAGHINTQASLAPKTHAQTAADSAFKRDTTRTQLTQSEQALADKRNQAEGQQGLATRQQDHNEKTSDRQLTLAERQAGDKDKLGERQQDHTERTTDRQLTLAEQQASSKDKLSTRQQDHSEKTTDRQLTLAERQAKEAKKKKPTK